MLFAPNTAAGGGEAGPEPGVSLTVYNQDFAMVRQRRLMELAEGESTLKFPEVAATIVPETVQFRSLRPGAAKVLEQNYEFDLLSAEKLLNRYVDRQIAVIGRDGSLIEGRLLSSDANQLVLSNRHGIDLILRGKNIKDIRFSTFPEGLLTRPTLVWKVHCEEAGEHLAEVAYRANSITWRVDYRAVASADDKTIDVSGWVTITNRTGTTFQDADLKLMAGDVHVEERRGQTVSARRAGTELLRRRAEFEEKAFAEYHLYTLGRTTTLANAQTKQIRLIEVEKIPVAKRYLYRPEFAGRVATVLEFNNSEQTRPGLGIPLPKGPFRVYRRAREGETEFVGKDEIDHTPKDERVRIRTGYAVGLVVERVQTANRKRAGENWNEQDWQITLRNHMDRPVKVAVEEPLEKSRNWRVLQCDHDYERKDSHTLTFGPDIPPDGQKMISYTVRYTW